MYFFIKRFFDILFATIILIIISPLLIPISLALLLTGEGYVFYKQERVGYLNRKFDILILWPVGKLPVKSKNANWFVAWTFNVVWLTSIKGKNVKESFPTNGPVTEKSFFVWILPKYLFPTRFVLKDKLAWDTANK